MWLLWLLANLRITPTKREDRSASRVDDFRLKELINWVVECVAHGIIETPSFSLVFPFIILNIIPAKSSTYIPKRA